ELFPLLRANGGGAIANIASQAALVSLPEQAAYGTSKGAVAALTRSLAIDWARDEVRVNAICPGFTITPMSEPAMTPELISVVERRVPLGRLFEAREMANVLVFLVSPLASAMTGVVLPVDGGWTAGEAELPDW
ncbi:MAG: SDR family NAD(P)-dependent oxidoreductase, partial [Gaiellales bacterium]